MMQFSPRENEAQVPPLLFGSLPRTGTLVLKSCPKVTFPSGAIIPFAVVTLQSRALEHAVRMMAKLFREERLRSFIEGAFGAAYSPDG
jgi:hypothetical protein